MWKRLWNKEGINHFETFPPVVQWMTVCVFLNMTILLNLHNKQIDNTAAFLKDPFGHDVYVDRPKTFTSPGKVWLKRAVYGLIDDPRVLYSYIKNWKISDFDCQMLTHIYTSHLRLLFFANKTTVYCYTKIQQQSIFWVNKWKIAGFGPLSWLYCVVLIIVYKYTHMYSVVYW